MPVHNISTEDIRLFILQWNKQYPIDHWWRQKYKVAFGSPSHLCMSHMDMLLDYQEEKLYEEMREKHKIEAEKKENIDFGLPGLNKEVSNMTEKEIDEEFENLDLSKFAPKSDINKINETDSAI